MTNDRRAKTGFHFRIGPVAEWRRCESRWYKSRWYKSRWYKSRWYKSRGVDGSRRARSGVVGAVGLVTGTVAVSLAGCAAQEPLMPSPAQQQASVTIGVDLTDAEQVILAQLYAQSFAKNGRDSEIVGLDHSDYRIDAVRTGHVVMSFGCTGELLGLSDPAAAAALSKEYAADPDPNKQQSSQWRDRVYDAFSRSLPGEVMVTDAGMAQGCEGTPESNPGSSLPQWLVPFYIKPALVRADRVNVLNEIAGSLSTNDLKTMAKAVAAGSGADEVAREWLEN